MTLLKSSELVSLVREKSKAVYQQCCQVIPSGVNSPVRSFPNLEQTPLVVERGKEDLFTDVDGYTYIDYCGSWGALIHGHAHPAIVKAAQDKMALGSSFGTATSIEGQIAAKVVQHLPSIEKVRFVSSGTEATMTALRLARGYTGKNYIIKFSGHYHGHADPFLVQSGSGVVHLSPTSSSQGIPSESVKYTLCVPYNDPEAFLNVLKLYDDQIAAVILEPVAANMGVVLPQEGFLHFLREETKKRGVLLIFDEVITGFRVALNGAQGYFGIHPDLTCLGKIVGGGFPAAAFGGRKEIMDLLAPSGPVYQAGTLSGNPVAMAAGLTTLTLLEDPEFYAELERKTRLITDPVSEYIKDNNIPACLQQIGSMFTLFFGETSVNNLEEGKSLNLKQFNDFFRYLFQRGIYIAPSQYEANFISMAHTEEHLLYTKEVMLEYLTHLKSVT